ncbi:hypothetical protein ANCCAN_02351 [Ancylostoma caninum]|uniref:Uncharacterized protein n=1 Tax=Ancylostoma caninum TaxID=29170 RepID=A0A368H467_ANCCA|nr:hypothetical protein ANCCAN_02351 [Ancylostoma caninum]
MVCLREPLCISLYILVIHQYGYSCVNANFKAQLEFVSVEVKNQTEWQRQLKLQLLKMLKMPNKSLSEWLPFWVWVKSPDDYMGVRD